MRNTMITRPGPGPGPGPDTRARMAQRGFTLVELMVAMTIGLLVAAAAVATLLVGRQGFNTVDSSTQLRETARFAANAIESAAVLAGFQNEAYGVETASRPPGIRGYTNALVSAAGANLPNGLAHNTRTATHCGAATGTACLNGSDVLVVNFWGASRNGSPDGTMIDCGGAAEPEGPGPGPTAYSIIHVATASTGEVNQEPSLACSYKDPLTGTFKTVPIVRGVESFRVLYGTYGVTQNVCSTAPSTTDYGLETAAETYLTAAQMDGAGTYCANNWARVRSLRIGLLVRGPVASAPIATAVSWNLLGAPNDLNFISPNDAWSTLNTAADLRARQQLVFTVHLRNPQN